MAEIVLFHHAQGRTDGVLALADQMREAGHVVHTPDTYQGRTFDTLEEGMAYARETGFGELYQRGLAAAQDLAADVVYAGLSLGVMPAQSLAQNRPGARGALLLEACAPMAEFGDGWPPSVPVQVHGMADDPFFGGEEGDVVLARELVAAAADGELFVYPGRVHLFTDASLPTYDAGAAALLTRRVLQFLDRVSTSVPPG